MCGLLSVIRSPGEFLYSLATVLEQQGKLDEATENYQRSLAAKEKRLGDEHSDVGSVHGSLALIMQKQGSLSVCVIVCLCICVSVSISFCLCF